MGLTVIISEEAAAAFTVIEDGWNRFVRNIGICLPEGMAEHPKR
jgi:hypothetical protein